MVDGRVANYRRAVTSRDCAPHNKKLRSRNAHTSKNPRVLSVGNELEEFDATARVPNTLGGAQDQKEGWRRGV